MSKTRMNKTKKINRSKNNMDSYTQPKYKRLMTNKTIRNFKPKCCKNGHYILDEIYRFNQMTEDTRLENKRRANGKREKGKNR